MTRQMNVDGARCYTHALTRIDFTENETIAMRGRPVRGRALDVNRIQGPT